MSHPSDWMEVRPEGLYCAAGDFYIDPVKPVPRAVVTHGHADHARAGHGRVYATPETLAIMRCRYGDAFTGDEVAVDYRQTILLVPMRWENASASYSRCARLAFSARSIFTEHS